MALMQGKWIKLDQKGTGPGARSAHAIAVVGQKVYAFGGECTPCVPVDNKLYVFDLETGSWSVVDASGDIPPTCLGVAMAAVGSTIYLFGGRDVTRKEFNDLYAFDTLTNEWKLLSSGDVGPLCRSYHSITADDRKVYVFGGCGMKRRLNDLWAYDVVDQKWVEYPKAGDGCKGRGGPGLAAVQGKIWVVYGFTGVEADDVHCFDLAQGTWTQVETSGEKPSARSVFATAVFGKHIIISGGEVGPSDLGHKGAGGFTGDVYGLDTETLVWKKWEDGVGQDGHPGPRGWCAFAPGSRDGKEGLLVHGGNSSSNDRLEDILFFTPTEN